jgi:hypothetical protein
MTAEVHVFGVLAAGDAVKTPAGTRLIAQGEVAALVSDTEGEGLSAARALREHWRILQDVAAQTTVLPIRFGTAMASDEAVVGDFLGPGHDALRTGIDALAGKVQLTVKGTYEQEALLRGVIARSPTIARLQAQVEALPEAASYAKRIQLGELVSLEVDRQREADAAFVVERLQPLAVATRQEAASGLDQAVNAAFLVTRDGVETFESAVAALGKELEARIGLRLIGPLPAYSFTPEGAAAWA